MRVKYWQIIADNLSRAGWSWGCVSAVDSCGRTIWIADAHRGDRKRFVVRADEKLTAFVELERITFDDDQLERFRGARRRACFPAEASGNQLRTGTRELPLTRRPEDPAVSRRGLSDRPRSMPST